MQTEEEAREIDVILRHMLRINNINFTIFDSKVENIDKIIDFIINQVDPSNSKT